MHEYKIQNLHIYTMTMTMDY